LAKIQSDEKIEIVNTETITKTNFLPTFYINVRGNIPNLKINIKDINFSYAEPK